MYLSDLRILMPMTLLTKWKHCPPTRSTSWRSTPCTSRGRAIMLLRSALILLVFFALIGACTEVALEQSATGTGQAAMQGPQVGNGVQDNCDLPLSIFHMDDISGTPPRVDPGRRALHPMVAGRLPNPLQWICSSFWTLSWPAPDLYSVALNGAHLDKIVDVEGASVDRGYFWDEQGRQSTKADIRTADLECAG